MSPPKTTVDHVKIFRKLCSTQYNQILRLVNAMSSHTYFNPSYVASHHPNSILNSVPSLPSLLRSRSTSVITALYRDCLRTQSDLSLLSVNDECGEENREKMKGRVELGERVLQTCRDEGVEGDMKIVALQCLLAGDI
mmetsp:Transcript_4567/g.9222  ORF Transcript_4567/g.9222 Transcript_4567/m.9222 type:complete len:138 (-) Transcript_4567:203-616(-)